MLQVTSIVALILLNLHAAAQTAAPDCPLTPAQQVRFDACQTEMSAMGCDRLAASPSKRNCASEAARPSILDATEIRRAAGCVQGVYGATIGAAYGLVASSFQEAEVQGRYFSGEVYRACVRREEAVATERLRRTSQDAGEEAVRGCKRRLLSEFPDLEARYAPRLDQTKYDEISRAVQARIRSMRERQPSLARFYSEHRNDFWSALGDATARQISTWHLQLSCYEPRAQQEMRCAAATVAIGGAAAGVRLSRALRGIGVEEGSPLMLTALEAEGFEEARFAARLAQTGEGGATVAAAPEAAGARAAAEGMAAEIAPVAPPAVEPPPAPASAPARAAERAPPPSRTSQLPPPPSEPPPSAQPRAPGVDSLETLTTFDAENARAVAGLRARIAGTRSLSAAERAELESSVRAIETDLSRAADSALDDLAKNPQTDVAARIRDTRRALAQRQQAIAARLETAAADTAPSVPTTGHAIDISRDAAREIEGLPTHLKAAVRNFQAEISNAPTINQLDRRWQTMRLRLAGPDPAYIARLNRGYRVVFSISPDGTVHIINVNKTSARAP